MALVLIGGPARKLENHKHLNLLFRTIQPPTIAIRPNKPTFKCLGSKEKPPIIGDDKGGV